MEIKEKLTIFRFFALHKSVANKANKYFNKDGFDLQVEQIPVLLILFFKGTISQQEIADIADRDKSSILRSILSLAGKGFVVTAADPFDKRKKMVQLTKEGRKLAEKIEKELIKMDSMIFSCLSEEEKEIFDRLLLKCEMHIAGL